jgi:hypothetical protein
VGTYRWKVRFCKSGESCVDRVLQEQIKLSMSEEGPREQRGENDSALRKANHSKDFLPQSLGGIGQTVQMLPAASRHISSGRNRTTLHVLYSCTEKI